MSQFNAASGPPRARLPPPSPRITDRRDDVARSTTASQPPSHARGIASSFATVARPPPPPTSLGVRFFQAELAFLEQQQAAKDNVDLIKCALHEAMIENFKKQWDLESAELRATAKRAQDQHRVYTLQLEALQRASTDAIAFDETQTLHVARHQEKLERITRQAVESKDSYDNHITFHEKKLVDLKNKRELAIPAGQAEIQRTRLFLREELQRAETAPQSQQEEVSLAAKLLRTVGRRIEQVEEKLQVVTQQILFGEGEAVGLLPLEVACSRDVVEAELARGAVTVQSLLQGLRNGSITEGSITQEIVARVDQSHVLRAKLALNEERLRHAETRIELSRAAKAAEKQFYVNALEYFAKQREMLNRVFDTGMT